MAGDNGASTKSTGCSNLVLPKKWEFNFQEALNIKNVHSTLEHINQTQTVLQKKTQFTKNYTQYWSDEFSFVGNNTAFHFGVRSSVISNGTHSTAWNIASIAHLTREFSFPPVLCQFFFSKNKNKFLNQNGNCKSRTHMVQSSTKEVSQFSFWGTIWHDNCSH